MIGRTITDGERAEPLKPGGARAYLATLLGVLGWKAPLALALMIGLSLMEGVGLLLLVPLLELVGLEAQSGGTDRLAELVGSAFALVGARPTLPSVLGAYVLIVGLHALLQRIQNTLSLSLEQDLVASLRQRLYRAIASSRWLFFSRRRSSDFTHALTEQLERVGGATQFLFSLLAESVVACVYLVLAFQVSAPLTLIVLVCGGGLALLLRSKEAAVRRAGEELSVAMGELYSATLEHLGGMKTAKSYNAEYRHADIFGRLTERVAHVFVETTRTHAAVKFWFDGASVLLLCAIIYASVEVLAVSATGLLLLLFLFFRLMPKFASLQQSYHQLVNLLPAFEAVRKLQAECDAAAEPPVAAQPVELREAIRFERVSFAYEPAGAPLVLRDLDLTIQAGRTTAIVGPSGAGKSTLADLVLGLISPTAGRVLIDETPLDAATARPWRERIGYVPQETFLFHDSVRANLLWACPAASEPDLLEALRLAAAEAPVLGLPDGLDTLVGDRGIRLSGGERQRLALARALLRQPALLILDEATSALDSENEQRIQRAIDSLHGRTTILVIAHRLSTVRRADVIHVLEAGRLVESGPWGALVARPAGRLRALARAQGIDLGEQPATRGVRA